MILKQKIFILFFSLTPILVFADSEWEKDSQNVNPFLQNVLILGETNTHNYRLLLYRGGFENIRSEIFIQKIAIDRDLNYDVIITPDINE